VETIFYFERLRAERIDRTREEPPRIIVLPFRYELYSTSIEDLVNSLETILNEVIAQGTRQKQKVSKVESEPEIRADQYLIKIEEMVRDFRSSLARTLMTTEEILFSRVVQDMSVFEQTRTFVLLLFVATEGIVRLRQEGDDIRITKVM
jgi:iron-sulfur cluster repair protein YtfE (RIC family)